MKKLIALALLAGAVSVATAGVKIVATVWVNASYNQASGSLGSTRNSANPNQFIGCSVSASPGYRYGVCYAYDGGGTYRSCFTADPFVLAAIDALPSDGSLQFGWTTTNSCSFVVADNYSYNEPKQ